MQYEDKWKKFKNAKEVNKYIEELENQIKQRDSVIKNDCEIDAQAREIARQVLTEFEVYGDANGVPVISDIVELLVNRIKTLEKRWKAFEEQNLKGLEGLVAKEEAPIFTMAVKDRDRLEMKLEAACEELRRIQNVVGEVDHDLIEKLLMEIEK